MDPNGKPKKTHFIKNTDKSGIIAVDQRNRKEFTLKNGYFVIFKDVERINELNDGKQKK